MKKKKKLYMRQCYRCDEIYRTEHKYSTVCFDCSLPAGVSHNGTGEKRKKTY